MLLASLADLVPVPLFLLPMYYPDMVLLPDGSMSYLDGPADPLFHVPVANELTHSVPPQGECGKSVPTRLAKGQGMDSEEREGSKGGGQGKVQRR